MKHRVVVRGVKYKTCPKCYSQLALMVDLVYTDLDVKGVVQACDGCGWKNHYSYKEVDDDIQD